MTNFKISEGIAVHILYLILTYVPNKYNDSNHVYQFQLLTLKT